MIELIAYGQRPTADNTEVGLQYTLDVSNAGALSLTYEVSKGDDVMGRFSPYSQTFRLPFTNINTEFFGHYYDLNISPLDITSDLIARFNVSAKCLCEIRIDGVPIIQGSLQLKNVHLKEEEFEIAVFGLEANLFQDMKNKKLIDLFINEAGVQSIDYDITLTGGNVIDSFDLANDATEGQIGEGVVIVPIMDYGFSQPYGFLHYENTSTALSGIGVADSLQPFMLKPAINVSYIFKEIINQAGYTLNDSAFLSSNAWTKLFMTLGDNMASVATRGIQGVCVAKPDTQVLNSFSVLAGGGNAFTVPFNAETGSGFSANPPLLYDEGGYYNTTTSLFTAPDSGYYNGEFHIRTDCGSVNNTVANYWFGVEGANYNDPLNGSSMDMVSPQYESGNSSSSNTISDRTLVWHCFLEEGQQLQCKVYCNIYSPGGGTSGEFKLLSAGTFFKVTSTNLVNGIASIPNNMPDMLQTAFIKDLSERFNLCIVGDHDDPSSLTIQPWQDYIDLGTHKDWTDRLDLSKKRTLTPPDKIRKKFVEFSDLEDPTKHNALFENVNGYPIGKYSQEIESDFAQGTLSNSPLFAPFQVSPVPISGGWATDTPDFLIAIQNKGDGSGPISEALPKLFYHNGMKTLDNDVTFFVGADPSTSYPLCLNFYNAGAPIELDSPLLLWNFQYQASSWSTLIGWTPSNQTYFARYYQQFLLSIYDDDARLLECSMVLSPADIFSFRFNDEIQIENTPFRVIKISNYQPYSSEPCTVQLLKKISRVPSLVLPDPDAECTLNLSGYTQDGNVIFTDPLTGVTSTGTEECCTGHGLYWTGTNCIWNHGQGGTGDGSNPSDPILEDFEKRNFLSGVGGFNSVKTLRAININPIQGEFSTSGLNNSSQAPSTAKDFVFYCTTQGSVAGSATTNGIDVQNSAFDLLPGMMCRFVLKVLSIQTDHRSASAGAFGETSFKVWTFVSKNIGGTITTTGSEQTDFAQDDANIGTRSISVGTVKGRTPGSANHDSGVFISCTGPADTIVSWHLDCSATFIDLSTSSIEPKLILLENLGKIMTENSSFLEQE
tara:strand:- start:1203 stop:4376 length:3174 start_codon:yes stop_codon:yes gene_type:complete